MGAATQAFGRAAPASQPEKMGAIVEQTIPASSRGADMNCAELHPAKTANVSDTSAAAVAHVAVIRFIGAHPSYAAAACTVKVTQQGTQKLRCILFGIGVRWGLPLPEREEQRAIAPLHEARGAPTHGY